MLVKGAPYGISELGIISQRQIIARINVNVLLIGQIIEKFEQNIESLVQDCSDSSALAIVLPQSCTMPSISLFKLMLTEIKTYKYDDPEMF